MRRYIIKTDKNTYDIVEGKTHIYIDGLQCNAKILDILLDLNNIEILELEDDDEED